MSQTAIIGGIVLMVVCCSSSSAMLMMGGGGDSDSSGSTPPPPSDSSGSTPPPPSGSSGSTPPPPSDSSGSTPPPPSDSSGSTPPPPSDSSGSTPPPPSGFSGDYVAGFIGSCDDLGGGYEDVSALSLQECGNNCKSNASSFPCNGFMWNGSTCRLYDNAWTTGTDICSSGWSPYRVTGVPQSDNFTSSYDDLTGSYSDIRADLRECKVACQNKGSACAGFMHNHPTCRMYEDGSSTGVDIQSTGWTAYRKA